MKKKCYNKTVVVNRKNSMQTIIDTKTVVCVCSVLRPFCHFPARRTQMRYLLNEIFRPAGNKTRTKNRYYKKVVHCRRMCVYIVCVCARAHMYVCVYVRMHNYYYFYCY